MDSLISLNWLAVLAHVGSAVVVIVLYNIYDAAQERSNVQTFRYQIAAPDTLPQCNTEGTVPPTPDKCNVNLVYQKPKMVTTFNIIYGTLAFFFFTALAHIYYGTDGFGSGNYTQAIRDGWNPYRWFEYALSASLMSVLVGLVDGTRDTGALIACVALTAAMMGAGFVTESALRGTISPLVRDTVRAATVVGWILFLGLWTILLYQFATTVSDVDTLYKGTLDPSGDPVRVPSWIWVVVILQLLYYASFGVVQLIHINRKFSGRPFNYVSIEKAYIFLSFFAKLSLAAGLSYGLIFRVKDCSP
jgi:hypothetical protein